MRVICAEVPVVDVEVRHFPSKSGWHGAEAFCLAELVDLLYHFDGKTGFGVFQRSELHVRRWLAAWVRGHGQGGRVDICVFSLLLVSGRRPSSVGIAGAGGV